MDGLRVTFGGRDDLAWDRIDLTRHNETLWRARELSRAHLFIGLGLRAILFGDRLAAQQMFFADTGDALMRVASCRR